MFTTLGLDQPAATVVPSLNFGERVDFRTYARVVRCASILSRQIADLMHIQEQFKSIDTMTKAMATGNLTRYVVEAADPHGVLTTQLGIVPSSLSDIPLHRNDPRGKLFVQGLEALSAPTVGGAIVDGTTVAIQTMAEMFTHVAPCIADLSARANVVLADVEALIEENRMRLHISAPEADSLYGAMSELALVSLPPPSIADDDISSLHSIIHTVGHLVSLDVQGSTVVPVCAGVYQSELTERSGAIGELGYTKNNLSGIVTKTKETLSRLTDITNQQGAILSRLTDLQKIAATDHVAMSCIIGWVASYSELMSGMITYSADALAIADAVCNGDGIDMTPDTDDDTSSEPNPALPSRDVQVDNTPVEGQESFRFI